MELKEIESIRSFSFQSGQKLLKENQKGRREAEEALAVAEETIKSLENSLKQEREERLMEVENATSRIATLEVDVFKIPTLTLTLNLTPTLIGGRYIQTPQC